MKRGTADAKILERNIALLMQRAYLPARPAPSFRSGLKHDYLSELKRQHVPAGERGPKRRRLPLVALAASLLLAFLIQQSRGSKPSVTAAQLIAKGQVAMSVDGDAWRAATPAELQDGLRLSSMQLAVQTDGDHGLALQRVDGELTLGPSSQARFDARADSLQVIVEAGALLLEANGAGRAPWSIQTPSGTLSINSGQLSLRVGPQKGALRALGTQPLEAHFEGSGWSHRWPEDGDLHLLQGQRVTSLAQGAPKASLQDARDALAPAEKSSHASDLESTLERVLQGRVTGPDGEPVTSFRLALLAASVGQTYVRPQIRDFNSVAGEFRWDAAPAGEHKLFVHAEGFALAHVGNISPGPEQGPLELQLELGADLHGYVFDEKTKQPIAGALVMSRRDVPQSVVFIGGPPGLLWLPVSTYSAADGSFVLLNLSSGEHGLHVSAPGYGPTWSDPTTLKNGESVHGLDLGLTAGGQVNGIVLNAAGQPQDGSILVISKMDQGNDQQTYYQQAFTDAAGRYRAEDLPLGMLLVVLIDRDQVKAPWVKPAVTRRGLETRLDFIEKGGGTRLHGRLLDARGEPMPFVKIAIFKQQDLLNPELSRSFEATTTNKDGHYAFKELSIGNYLLMRVEANNVSIRPLGQARIAGRAKQALDLRIGTRQVSGQVLDARSGLPLIDADISLWFRDTLAGKRNFGGDAELDAEGRFHFSGLAPGEYWVSAHTGGELGFALSAPFQLGDNKALPEIKLQLAPGGGVRLLVLDLKGTSLAHCSLSFHDENGPTNAFGGEAKTDKNGVFEGQGLHPGRYRVRIRNATHQAQELSFTCQVGLTTKVDVRLAPNE